VKNALEIPVSGTGHAIKVSSASSDDYIYTGKGVSSFAGFTTDADIVFIRENGDNRQVGLFGGSDLIYQGDPWIILSKKADSVIINRTNGLTDYYIQGESDLRGDIFQQTIESNKIEVRSSRKEPVVNNGQQKSIEIVNTLGISGKSSDILSPLARIVKRVLSFFS
jgi:hypothetical protein